MREPVLLHLTTVIVFSAKQGFTCKSNLEDDFELKKKKQLAIRSQLKDYPGLLLKLAQGAKPKLGMHDRHILDCKLTGTLYLSYSFLLIRFFKFPVFSFDLVQLKKTTS